MSGKHSRARRRRWLERLRESAREQRVALLRDDVASARARGLEAIRDLARRLDRAGLPVWDITRAMPASRPADPDEMAVVMAEAAPHLLEGRPGPVREGERHAGV